MLSVITEKAVTISDFAHSAELIVQSPSAIPII